MPKGQYAVHGGMDVEASKRTARDNSYRACIHAMLIFIAICIILLVCAWPWNKHRAPKKAQDANMTDPSSDAIRGDEELATTYDPPLETTQEVSRTTPSKSGWSPRSTRTTPTSTEPIERKPHTVVPDVVPEATPEPEGGGTTAFAVERKPLYKVDAVDEDEEATAPSASVTPEVPAPAAEEAPSTSNTTTEAGSTTPLAEEVEVFTQSVENTQQHYELSPNAEATAESDSSEATSRDPTQGSIPADDVTVVAVVAPVSDASVKIVNPVCETSQCKALATRMLTLMNHSVDPCEDFYEFACGGLRFNPTLLGDDPSKDVYDRIRRGMDSIVEDNSCQAHRKFKKFYKSCVEFDAVSKDLRIAEVRRILETIGHFIELDDEGPAVENLTTLISKLMLHHSTPLFDLMMDVDGHNPTVFALKLTAPVFKPPFKPHDRRDDCLKASLIGNLNLYYEEYIRCKKEEHIIYLQELDDALSDLSVQRNTITAIRQNLEWNLLSAMDDLPEAGVMQQQLTGKEYKLMTISQLNSLYSQVEWHTLVEALLKRSVSDQTHVQVYFSEYLTKMFAKFQELKPRQQQNVLLGWLAHDLYVDLVLTRDSCSRDAYCLRVASDLMEDVSSSLYLETFKQGTLRALRSDAQELFKQLRGTLEAQLRDAPFLDDGSRSAAVSKVKSLTLEAGGGVELFLNETFLDHRMKEIEVQDANYITMSVSLLRRYRQLMYSLYTVKPSEPKAIWSHFLLPYSTQGIVIYALKKVVIPYGLMQKPMHEASLPRYLLMARLGFVIAHEMAHHFDVNGMSYGPNGRGDYLLSVESIPAFRESTNCPKDQNSFQGYHTADDGRSIKFRANESLSLNERLADRTAAALSYDTYKSWVRDLEPPEMPYLGLSNDQVYFLAMAQVFCSKSSILDYGVSMFEDEHPPPFLRVNTIVDNSKKFPEVFECKQGVRMNPSADVKCEAFPHLTPIEGEKDFSPSE